MVRHGETLQDWRDDISLSLGPGWESRYKTGEFHSIWADIERIYLIICTSRAAVVEAINSFKKPRKNPRKHDCSITLLNLYFIPKEISWPKMPRGSATANSRLEWIWTLPGDTWQPQVDDEGTGWAGHLLLNLRKTWDLWDKEIFMILWCP